MQKTTPTYFIRIAENYYPKNKFQEEIIKLARKEQHQLCTEPKKFFNDFSSRIEFLRKLSYKRCTPEKPMFEEKTDPDGKEKTILVINKLLVIKFILVKGTWTESKQ